MPYVKEYEEFASLAEKLFKSNPASSRYTTKYDSKKGSLTIKVTDNAECYIYTTNKMSDLKKSEELTRNLMKLCVN
uniref:Signal recognition particle 9 kDa protein n=1 Tax=Parastrongyloides trichosuri TaxID=131310 RepID=A0A0N4ZEZ3_PARTI